MAARIVATDSWPIEGASVDALDMALVQQHIASAKREGRYNGTTDPIAYLRYNHLVIDSAGTLVPTLAGMLAFGSDPERWLSASCGIDIAEFRTNTPTTKSLNFIEHVRGPIFSVVDRAADILWARTRHDVQIEGTQRVEQHAYSQVVLRELTVNALCHRDWNNTSSRVRIQIFPDSIEWISPGGLTDGVTIENLLDAQASRNPAIVSIMFQARYIEGLGLGFDSIYTALAENGVEPPLIRNNAHSLSIHVKAKAIATNQNSAEPAYQDPQQAILTLIARHGGASTNDIEGALGLQRRTIQRYIQTLLQEHKIEAEGATNRRRYRLPKS